MAARTAQDPQVQLLLVLLEQAYRKKSWHGTNLRGSIRGLSIEQACWKPAADRHSIWEHVLHAAYWKYSIVRRVNNLAKGSFPYKGSNWFTPVDFEPASWKRDLKFLQSMHAELIAAVGQLRDKDLAAVPDGSSTTLLDLIQGVAFHDIYHAGQIQLLKRLQGSQSDD